MQLQMLHLVRHEGRAIPNLGEHALAPGVVVVHVHVEGCEVVPVAEEDGVVVVDGDLEAAGEVGRGVVVADGDFARRLDEHAHSVGCVVGA